MAEALEIKVRLKALHLFGVEEVGAVGCRVEGGSPQFLKTVHRCPEPSLPLPPLVPHLDLREVSKMPHHCKVTPLTGGCQIDVIIEPSEVRKDLTGCLKSAGTAALGLDRLNVPEPLGEASPHDDNGTVRHPEALNGAERKPQFIVFPSGALGG